ncbi:AAA family ATPase [Lutibacter holmesii]|uniref:AAA family ATPase n=1 Tax=Lutibacter holmesii TaxID=1137985 RepID=A0ABW3WRS8_9FLAO
MGWFHKNKDKFYKFKSLQTYAWDRTINNNRKYRTVFDKQELNYLSVGLEFYNKLFDEKDWKAIVVFKAYKIDDDKKSTLLCEKEEEYTITKDLNIAVCDYGWGNDDYGSFWKKGTYCWDAYIDEKYITSTKFYIEDVGKVSTEENPYFGVVSAFTYETDDENDTPEKRLYLKQFMYKQIEYVFTEFKFISKVDHDWLCELFFNYYDDSGLLIGTSNTIEYITTSVNPNELQEVVCAWGSTDNTVWLRDNYRVEVVFMDTVVAKAKFSIGDDLISIFETIDDLVEPELDEEDPLLKEVVLAKPEEISAKIENRPLPEILEELNSLVGLQQIKNKIKEYIDYVTYLQLRKNKGIEDDDEINLHSVFTGNPGTGKTTVVKLLGEIYKAMGLLSKGHVLTVESNDLITGYVRQTGENTKEIIEKARGGILFIDEAYMLFKDGAPNDFGPEAIAALITEMSDGIGDIAIMVAGYPKEMERFMASNPGLKSRFRNYYHFKDYSPNELTAIAMYAAHKKEVVLSEAAISKLSKIITNAFRDRDHTFGNARLINALIDEAKMNLGIRLVRTQQKSKLTKEVLSTIQEEDIEDVSEIINTNSLKLPIDTALLSEAVNELNNLIGLTHIKQEVEELIKLTKYYKEINRDVLKAFSMHSIFLGNPGTGKTTVARIIGKIYKALGLLERGHVVEVDGSSLIAGYVGQTSLKTKELIKKAMGGVLFIDEAYAITEGTATNSANNFGKKAIAALIKEMEDHRGKFSVIVAGYTQNMKGFIKSNPGLKSRFDKTFHFNDFTENEMWEITKVMLHQKQLKTTNDAELHLKKYINVLYTHRSPYFGNARSIRKIVEKTVRNQELRMANLTKKQRTNQMISTVEIDDVIEFNSDKIEENKSVRIGYKSNS